MAAAASKKKATRRKDRSKENKAAAAKAASKPLTAKKKAVRKRHAKGATKPIPHEELERVIERMCEGESLRQICADPAMPSVGGVLNYAMLRRGADDPFVQRFAEAYSLAKEIRAEAWADEIVDIADMTEADRDHVAKDKLRIESRKWLLSKLLDRQYGDKSKHEVTGKDGGPVKTESSVQFYLPQNGREANDDNTTEE